MSNAQQINSNIAMAQKCLKKSFFHSPDFFSASQHYEKAGIMFKLDKKYAESAECYEKAAECCKSCNDFFDVGKNLEIAAMSYHLASQSTKARECYLRAVDAFVGVNHLGKAGSVLFSLYEMLNKQRDYKAALEYLRKAIEYKEAGNEPVAASQMWSKVVTLTCKLGEYAAAQNALEKVAESASLTSSKVDAYADASFCALATGDIVALENALEKYSACTSSFISSPEYGFLDFLARAIKDNDLNEFDNLVKNASSHRVHISSIRKDAIESARNKIKAMIEESVL